jgi:hypothetical protein
MSSDKPKSLRNVPPEIMHMAQAISQRNGLSLADILRLALITGMFVEAAKAGPDAAGRYADLDVDYLATSLRRLLAAPIDLLIERQQHPYLTAGAANGVAPPAPGPALAGGEPLPTGTMQFDDEFADELESLGMGVGLSAELIDEPIPS